MSIRLKCLSPRPMASLRLLCIPFAGGGAGAFRGWADLLPAHVEAFAVQLPGREDRLDEAPLTQWPAMLEALVARVSGLHPQRTAIFGHSLGAVIGFELARRMAQSGSALEHLFVSARPWPGGQAASPALAWPADDDAMLAELERRYGGLPASLSHPDIRAVVLPALRADLHLLGDHRYRPAPPLPCPLTVFAGARDPGTGAGALAGWQAETAAAFDSQLFDGGHFFIESHGRELVAAIASRLPAAPPW